MVRSPCQKGTQRASCAFGVQSYTETVQGLQQAVKMKFYSQNLDWLSKGGWV